MCMFMGFMVRLNTGQLDFFTLSVYLEYIRIIKKRGSTSYVGFLPISRWRPIECVQYKNAIVSPQNYKSLPGALERFPR